jgi:hypothetical protein
VDAAGRAGHPVAGIARERVLAAGDLRLVEVLCEAAVANKDLATFCAAHGLAPADPVRRAAFLLLTHQFEQYHAADPDGSLLALAYETAPEEERRRLREDMLRAGDLDVVRVVAGADRGQRIADRTTAELDYLTRRLAGREEWDGLWSLVRDLPLLRGVHAMRLFPGSWRPAEAPELYLRFAGADADVIAAAHEAIARPAPIRIELDAWVVHGALSADGRTLVLLTKAFRPYDHGHVRVYELPGGRLTDERRFEDVHHGRVLHAGDSIVLALDDVMRLGPGRAEVLVKGEEYRPDLMPANTPSGFVVLAGHEFVFFEPERRTVRFREPVAGRSGTAMDVEPGTGRLAVGDPWARDGEVLRVLTPDGERVIAAADGVGAAGIRFTGPDRLVSASWQNRGMVLWQIDGDRLVRRAQRALNRMNNDLSLIPQRGEIALIDRPEPRPDSRLFVKYVDAATFADVEGDRELTGIEGRQLWSSPGNLHHALGGRRDVHVVLHPSPPEVAELAARPLADLRPGDLRTVTAELREPLRLGGKRPYFDLLRACLEHRFAADVALGSAVRIADDHDIALGGSG